ncbi:hypothetical protein GA0115240_11277, partial [Streptomyces sp. DvalAA-14]
MQPVDELLRQREVRADRVAGGGDLLGVAPTAISALAGSPGSSRSSRNSTTLAMNSETTRKASRRRTYVVIR